MEALRIEATIEKDGELHLRDLPCRKGERVEAILLRPEAAPTAAQREARERFLTRARASRFRSEGPYPSRQELHERS